MLLDLGSPFAELKRYGELLTILPTSACVFYRDKESASYNCRELPHRWTTLDPKLTDKYLLTHDASVTPLAVRLSVEDFPVLAATSRIGPDADIVHSTGFEKSIFKLQAHVTVFKNAMQWLLPGELEEKKAF